MTRHGLVADVHGNFEGLAIALQILDPITDNIKHLGDLVFGLSRQSEKAISLLFELGIKGVWGWHDKEEMEYDSEKLSEKSREYLFSLPQKIMLNDDTILIHDSPLSLLGRSFEGMYVDGREDAQKVFEKCSFKRMIVGHNHIASFFCEDGRERIFEEPGIAELDPSKRYILCPGSVGMPRDALAHYGSCAIYDDEKQTFEILRFGNGYDRERKINLGNDVMESFISLVGILDKHEKTNT